MPHELETAPSQKGERTVRVVALAAGACFAITFAMRVRAAWVFTVDDTFITLRYAKHLASGLGPAWNPGGPAVEGYTSASWMVLLALPHLFGANALVFAKLASTLCGLGCAGAAAHLALRLVRGFQASSRAVALALTLAVCAAYGPLALHAVSGMETTAFALLVTAFFAASVAFCDRPSPRLARALAVIALTTTLTRPEGALVCGVSLLVLAARDRCARAMLLRAVAAWTIAPGLAYFVARYLRYGLLLPLPFYVKAAGQPGLRGAEDVVAFFAPLLREQPYLAAAVVLALSRFGERIAAAALGALAFVTFFLVPEHVMGFEGRYLFPVFPLLAALIGAGCAVLTESLLTRRARALALAPALVLVGLLAVCPLPSTRAAAQARWTRYGLGLARAHVALGRELARLRWSTPRPTIALLDVGAIGYYGDWRVIDTFGLNDVRVALSRRGDVEYVLANEPELLVVVSAARDRFVDVFAWEAPLYAAARARQYELACDYEFARDYHLHVLAARGSAIARALSCAEGRPPMAAR